MFQSSGLFSREDKICVSFARNLGLVWKWRGKKAGICVFTQVLFSLHYTFTASGTDVPRCVFLLGGSPVEHRS